MMDKMRARFYETHRILVVKSPTLCAGLLRVSPSRALLKRIEYWLSTAPHYVQGY